MFSKITLFDNAFRENLKPLTFTRPISELRVGILTIREKWETTLNLKADWLTESWLQDKFPFSVHEDTLFIYGGCMPTSTLVNQLSLLKFGDSIWSDNQLILYFGNHSGFKGLLDGVRPDGKQYELDGKPAMISQLYHILDWNKQQITADYNLLTTNRASGEICSSVSIIGDLFDENGQQQLFLDKGATAGHITVNLKEGPVFLGSKCEVMEGSHIRGPVAVCENAKVNMGARIYSGTTVGPWCKVGGEISNSVFIGYSNKGHEGFLGDSVIGEWCNLGADSNNSNLKNDYSEVKLWNYPTNRFIKTGRQFCGLIMGDFSRSGINTMFNTGTVTGVGANIAGSGFPRNFVPSFTLTTNKLQKVSLESTLLVAQRLMARRNRVLSEIDRAVLERVFLETQPYRERI